MQDPRMPPSEDISNPKPPKKKTPPKKPKVSDVNNNAHLLQTEKKALKRSSNNDMSLFKEAKKSNSNSLPDMSPSIDKYKTLRRKYLLLEEENIALEREFNEVEDEVRTLEAEKLQLLDQLIVLEGLIDPLELQSCGVQLPYLPISVPRIG